MELVVQEKNQEDKLDFTHDRESKKDPLRPLRIILLAAYSQESLAKMCDVNRSTISRVFNGLAKPSYRLEMLLHGFASAVLNEYEELFEIDSEFYYKQFLDSYKFPKYPYRKYPMNGFDSPQKRLEGENDE